MQRPITPAEAARHDQLDAHIRDRIRGYGWAAEYVSMRRGEFVYTVGLHGLGHPELVLAGCEPDGATHVLGLFASQVLDGAQLSAGERIRVAGYSRVFQLLDLPNPAAVLTSAYRFYRCSVPGAILGYQVCWSDEAGRFPWQQGCAPDTRRQPEPGEFP